MIGKAKKSTSHSSRRCATEIKRDLVRKKKMQRDFLKRVTQRGESSHSRRPYGTCAYREVSVTPWLPPEMTRPIPH
jgi:hypothetical protein